MKWALGFVLLGVVGCEPVDLVVVRVPDGGAFAPPLGSACAQTAECMAGQLCEKSGCGEALGRCIARPPVCDGELRPECGCDGVNYWNECVRRAAGVEARADRGPCRAPRACDTTAPCPSGAYCARLVFPNECGRVAAGACYVVPQSCQPSSEHYFSCAGPMTACLDACAAIRSEQPAAQVPGPCP